MKKIASFLALKFVGLPYIWGGDDAVAGFDCSGLVIEILKSVGILPRKGDWTAETLFLRFRDKKVLVAKEGCLVFYANTKYKVNHVEYIWKRGLTIGASGGGSTTLTRKDAIKQNAYVKIRPMRKGYYAIVNPFK
ncbi:unnamed protein product [marine sediment metagenome]|uniref:NlpC/P60 domain-containing protein n=1 Tax=marine sediment metagenome TaxID=412755 RepID=X0XT51_9ZZZZ